MIIAALRNEAIAMLLSGAPWTGETTLRPISTRRLITFNLLWAGIISSAILSGRTAKCEASSLDIPCAASFVPSILSLRASRDVLRYAWPFASCRAGVGTHRTSMLNLMLVPSQA
jgi:hypothetical protein